MAHNTSLLRDTLTTALAPCIWGSTYIVATEFLPSDRPLTAAVIRVLPVGIIMLALTRSLPKGHWWWKLMALGMLNIGIFQALLFIAAYRLPGGVAATVGAIQPLVVALLAWAILQATHSRMTWIAAVGGLIGVGMLVLGPSAQLDMIGIFAALAGAVSMALGTVLTKRWHAPFSIAALTAWQLIFGGIFLSPLMYFLEEPLYAVTLSNVVGYSYLGIVGTGMTYAIWFRGIHRLHAPSIALLGLLSPIVATLLGYVFLYQSLTAIQLTGGMLVLGSVWMGHSRAEKIAPANQPFDTRN